MNKKSLLLIPLLLILVCGCRGKGNTSTSSSESTSHSSSQTTSGGTSISSSSNSKTSSTSTTTTPTPETITIKDALVKGESYKEQVTPGSHEYFGETISTKGRVIQAVAIGIQQNILVYICDGKDMIPCLTGGTSNFYKACKDYIGKETSNYVLTGRIGYYYSTPCLEVTGYQLNTSMTFNIDYKSFDYDQYSTVEPYNTYLESLDYNKKGYGQGKLVKLNNFKCIAKGDDNSWLFSDGTHVQGVYHQTSNTAYSVGSQYNIYGLSCLYQWKPSLRTFVYEISSGSPINVDIESLAIEKTAESMYSVGAPGEDTEKCENTNKFIRTFKYFYKADLYFNYYTENGIGYVVAGDNYYSSVITSKTTASSNKMFLFNNDSYNRWNSSIYVPVVDYLCENTILTSYFVEYQFTTVNKKEMPQVYMFEDLIPYVY